MTNHSTSVQRVQNALADLGSTSKVIEFAESTKTAQEAADRVGCQLGQIVKSMVFKGQSSGRCVLVLTSGANRVDEKSLSEHTGELISRADPEFVRTMTGFAIGGVPPVGHIHNLETFIDEDLLAYTSIWAAGGSPNAVFEITPHDLVRFTTGRVVRVKP